jgi:hypothetical protein
MNLTVTLDPGNSARKGWARTDAQLSVGIGISYYTQKY